MCVPSVLTLSTVPVDLGPEPTATSRGRKNSRRDVEPNQESLVKRDVSSHVPTTVERTGQRSGGLSLTRMTELKSHLIEPLPDTT